MQANVVLQQAARYNGKISDQNGIHDNMSLIKANEFTTKVPKPTT